MGNLHVVIISLFLLTTGCASYEPPVKQAEIDKANNICTHQVNQDKAQYHPYWFTRWLKCKQERVMPFEILIYPHKEAKIRAMYSKLLEMGVDVDSGVSRVGPVYDEWDRMQAEIGMFKGKCVTRRDGSQKCVDPKGSILFIRSKDGDIETVR